MDRCDVLIVGGGPGGSACAWRLAQAGLDVVVADKAVFPRDKVCAGWITPQTIADVRIDPDEYRAGRTFQPITGFRVGLIGPQQPVEVCYDRPVSFGIRRCEFDDYLLRRSGARLLLGTAVSTIRRHDGRWVVNDTVSASMLVGAAGHFCPVARMLNAASDRAPLVAAQEIEWAVDPRTASSLGIAPDRPELYFCQDLAGYGWCFRKGDYLNVGLGRLDRHAVRRAAAEFMTFLTSTHRIPPEAARPLRGHAYLLAGSRRRVIDEAVILVGDAAGLAYPHSGEGIRPAIESGLLAASAIANAKGRYGRRSLAQYERTAQERFGLEPRSHLLSGGLPAGLSAALARRLLGSPAFVRHVVLDRWFLHAHEPRLAVA